MKLEESFLNPPAEYRIFPITHSFIFDRPLKEVKYLLKMMKDIGAGGLVVNVGGRRREYGSEEKFKTFIRSLKEAVKEGFPIWLYDEDGYPSGVASGQVLEGNPNFRLRGLLYWSQISSGPVSVDVDVSKDPPVYVVAAKVEGDRVSLTETIDLTERIHKGRLTCKLPRGEWKIMGFFEHVGFETCTLSVDSNQQWKFVPYPYVNLLDPEVTRKFISLTHEKYAKWAGENLGSEILAFFTDEPGIYTSPLVEGSLYGVQNQEYPAIPWTEELSVYFKEKKGYDIIPKLPALFTNVGEETSKFRCDFYDVVADLYVNSYFAQLERWCEDHKVKSSGHILAEESLIEGVAFEIDPLRALKHMQIPGMDILLHYTIIPTGCKLVSSAAHLCGKDRVFTESFGLIGKEGFFQKAIAVTNWQFVLGVNFFTSYAQTENYTREEYRLHNEYVGRLGLMLTGGRHIADIAVLYPLTSVWANYIPTKTPIFIGNPEGALGLTGSKWREDYTVADMMDKIFIAISQLLLQNQFDYDYIDEESLIGCRIKEGRLTLYKEGYRVLVLPPLTTVKKDSWKKIKEFVTHGGIVVSINHLPSESMEEGVDSEIKTIARELFDINREERKPTLKRHPNGGMAFFVPDATLVPSVLEGCLTHSFKPAEPCPSMYYLHKQRDNADIFFVINNSEETVSRNCYFKAKGTPENWNLKTGKIEQINNFTQTSDGILAPIQLQAWEGKLIVFH